jgi:hypothetical protein
MPHQARLSIRGIIFFCWSSTFVLAVAIMAYAGMFDGMGDTIYEALKPIAKYFFQ